MLMLNCKKEMNENERDEERARYIREELR